MNEGPRRPRAEGQFSLHCGLKGQRQPKIADFQRPDVGFSNHGTQPASEASQGPGEGPPFPVAPVTAMGLLLSSLHILSLCGYVLFCRSGMLDSLRPWTAARQASLSRTISQSLLKLTSIELVMPSKPSHPLSSPSPPALNLSQHQSLFQ